MRLRQLNINRHQKNVVCEMSGRGFQTDIDKMRYVCVCVHACALVCVDLCCQYPSGGLGNILQRTVLCGVANGSSPTMWWRPGSAVELLALQPPSNTASLCIHSMHCIHQLEHKWASWWEDGLWTIVGT